MNTSTRPPETVPMRRRDLEDIRFSLEYVNRMHPEATGWGVRAELVGRIDKALHGDKECAK